MWNFKNLPKKKHGEAIDYWNNGDNNSLLKLLGVFNVIDGCISCITDYTIIDKWMTWALHEKEISIE